MPEILQSASTTQYTITRKYVRNEGKVQIPVASDEDDAECEFARLSASFESLRVEWLAQKFGAPPDCPDPASLGENNVLLQRELGTAVPPPHGQGSGHYWTLSGAYIYGLKKPKDVTPDLPTGKMPFEKTLASDNLIPKTVFKKDILGSD